jgi:transcription elongation factor Elf1
MSAAMTLTDELESPAARTTMLFRFVEFVCPVCGDERGGVHVDGDDGVTFVECGVCNVEHPVSVLAVPTQAKLDEWRADAVHRGNVAVRSADGVHGCSLLAIASCRRLADELTGPGKLRLLDEIARSVGGDLHQAQRGVLAELGAALGLPAGAINATLALI